MADPIFDQVMNIAQGQRALQASDTSNALNAARTQQVVRQMQNEDKGMQLMQAMAGIRLKQQDKDKGVTKDDMEPPLLRDANAQMQEAMQQEALFMQQAEVLAPYAPEMAKNFRSTAEAYGRQAATWQTKYLSARDRLEKDIGQNALSYKAAVTPEDKQGAIDALYRLDPRWDRDLLGADRETGTLKIVPGAGTDKAMMVYAASKVAPAAQIAQADRAAALTARMAEDASKEALRQSQIAANTAKELRERDAVLTKGAAAAEARATKRQKADEEFLKAVNPTKEMVAEVAPKLQKDYKLSDTDVGSAARDFLIAQATYKLKYMDEPDRDDRATEEAYGDIEKKMVDNPKVKGGKLYNPRGDIAKPDEPSIWSRAIDTVTGAAKAVAAQPRAGAVDPAKLDASMKAVDSMTPALRAKGVIVSVTGNKVKLSGSSPLIKQAQEAIDAGRPPEAVLKMLQGML